MSIGSYTKAIAGAVLAGLFSYSAALADGVVTGVEALGVAAALLVAAAAIWRIPTAPKWLKTYGKAAAAGVLGVLGVLTVALLGGGITAQTWVQAVAALLVGSGVTGVAPNSFASDDMLPGYDRYAAAEGAPQYDPDAYYGPEQPEPDPARPDRGPR